MMRVTVSNNKRNSASKRFGCELPQDGRTHIDKRKATRQRFFHTNPPIAKRQFNKPPLCLLQLLTLRWRAHVNDIDIIADADGNGRSQICVAGLALGQRDAFNFINGFSGDISGKSGACSFHSFRSWKQLHAIAVAELRFGLQRFFLIAVSLPSLRKKHCSGRSMMLPEILPSAPKVVARKPNKPVQPHLFHRILDLQWLF
jgi:hypothetical protein